MQSAKKRAKKQDRADHRRCRIARQAKHPHPTQQAMHQRLAGAHGDAPEAELHSGGDERLLHEVVVADRSAAKRHQHVGAGGLRPPDRLIESADRVGGDTQVDRDASAGFDDPGHGKVVRCDDLRWAERSARGDKFVSGRQYCDPRSLADREINVIGRGRQRDVARREAPPRRNKDLALAKVQSRGTDVVARGHDCRELDAVAVAAHVFLYDDCIGAFGHRRAGKNPRRLARPDDAVESPPRGGFADDGQPRGKNGGVRRAQRETVHRRIGERRLGAQRDEIARQHAAMRGFWGDALLSKRRLGGSQHPLERFRDRDHAVHPLMLLVAPFARFAAALLDETDAFDDHAAIDRLGHVVDGEAGHGDRGQRLHLDPSRPDAARLGADR